MGRRWWISSRYFRVSLCGDGRENCWWDEFSARRRWQRDLNAEGAEVAEKTTIVATILAGPTPRTASGCATGSRAEARHYTRKLDRLSYQWAGGAGMVLVPG